MLSGWTRLTAPPRPVGLIFNLTKSPGSKTVVIATRATSLLSLSSAARTLQSALPGRFVVPKSQARYDVRAGGPNRNVRLELGLFHHTKRHLCPLRESPPYRRSSDRYFSRAWLRSV